jgi:integrase
LGYIKRLADKKYRIMYDLPPQGARRRQKTETLVGVTKKQAELYVADREKAVIKGDYVEDSGATLNSVFDRFMAAKQKKCAATTLQRYEGLLREYLRPTFGSVKLLELRTADIVAGYADWSQGDASARTLLHAHDLMRNVLNRAVKWGLAHRSVADNIDTDDLPKAAKPESTVLTESELRRLLDEAKTPTSRSKARGYLSGFPAFYPAVAFAAYTGARRGEVLSVRWRDLDLENGTVTIARSLSDTRGGLAFKAPKNGKSRDVELPASLVAILKSHHAAQARERLALGAGYADGDLVFARPDGSPMQPWNFGAAFADLVRRAGVTRIRLHDLRDTHASLAAKAGVPIEVLSRRLGHSSIAITMDRYLVVYRDRDRTAADAFDRLVGAVC